MAGATLNRFEAIGRLTRDPELRYLPNGTALCSFSLAIDRPFNNKYGDKDTDFIDFTAWSKKAEVISEYTGKGDKVYVDGRLQIEEWQTDEGSKRRKAVIVVSNIQFLETRKKERREEGYSDRQKKSKRKPPPLPPKSSGQQSLTASSRYQKEDDVSF